MKGLFCLVIFAITSTIQLYAQKEDSLSVKQKATPRTVTIDSLIPNRRNSKALPPESLKKADLYSLVPKERKMNMELDLPEKKKTFFHSSYSKFVIPAALISYGLFTRGNSSLLNLDHSTNEEIQEDLPNHVSIDNYTQFSPSIAVFGLDLVGIKAKHNLRDQALIMTTSYLIMTATVQTAKRTFLVERPDGSDNHSFPSGHTATAFVGAHILFNEYKDVSPWIGIGGYLAASATGAMRVYNKKHWISDVVTGAGVGILSAELGYILLPTWHKIMGIKNESKSLVVMPTIGSSCVGVGLAYTF